jgi:hypothetical protein
MKPPGRFREAAIILVAIIAIAAPADAGETPTPTAQLISECRFGDLAALDSQTLVQTRSSILAAVEKYVTPLHAANGLAGMRFDEYWNIAPLLQKLADADPKGLNNGRTDQLEPYIVQALLSTGHPHVAMPAWRDAAVVWGHTSKAGREFPHAIALDGYLDPQVYAPDFVVAGDGYLFTDENDPDTALASLEGVTFPNTSDIQEFLQRIRCADLPWLSWPSTLKVNEGALYLCRKTVGNLVVVVAFRVTEYAPSNHVRYQWRVVDCRRTDRP